MNRQDATSPRIPGGTDPEHRNSRGSISKGDGIQNSGRGAEMNRQDATSPRISGGTDPERRSWCGRFPRDGAKDDKDISLIHDAGDSGRMESGAPGGRAASPERR